MIATDINDQIMNLHNAGYSSRKICKMIDWSETKKSTVNNIINRNKSSVNVKQPRILFFDLESSLMQGYFFGMWQQNINMRRINKLTHLLSVSWAYNDGEVVGYRLTPEDVKTGNDFDVVVKMVEAINNSDIIVTFNGKRFDSKLINTRALFWGLPPTKIVKHIDLMEQAKRVFKFPSNSMDNISKYLGLDGKIKTSSSSLWERCIEYQNYDECDNALSEMLTYNKQDIVVTRALYKRMQGWMKSAPNIGTITSEITGNKTLRCIHCGSDDIHPMNDLTFTAVSSFELYRCGNVGCRGISRITKNGKNLTGVV